MLDYRTLYKMMRKYYDPRNSTSRFFYQHTTGKTGPAGTPGSRAVPGISSAYGNSPKVRFHFGTVIDNKDPDGWSRVKVRFPQWGDDFISDWSPVVRPFGGADRGIFVLPEIDEMVICAFLGDKPTRPMVLGSVYTPIQPNPFGDNPDNNLKLFMSKSNMRLEMNDTEGEETITLYMKEGKMRVVMKKDTGMEIINELGDVTIKCRKLIVESGDTANFLFQKDLKINADEISLEAKKSISGKAGGSIRLKGQDIALDGKSGVTAENKQIAAQGDLVVGVDTHIEMVPSGNGTTPVPIPNPYIGKLTDKLSGDVTVKGKYAAVKGSVSKGNGPGHILLPPGVKWQKSPTNKGEVISGTIPSVKINNKETAVLGSTVKTCADPIDAPNSTIVATGVPIKVPVMVPGMDKGQFERDGGVVINTREPVAKDGAGNEKDYALKDPRWSREQATVGEAVGLSVRCQNIYDGANIYFSIWGKGADRTVDAPVKKITGKNEGGEAKVQWKYFVPRDVEDPERIMSEFIFTVDAFRCEQVEADLIAFTDNVHIYLLNAAQNGYVPVKNQVTITGNSGNRKTFNADDSTGIIKGESVSVGSLKMTIDAREGIDQGDTCVKLEDIEDREQRKVIQVDRFDFENDHIDIQSGRAYIIIFSMGKDILSG